MFMNIHFRERELREKMKSEIRKRRIEETRKEEEMKSYNEMVEFEKRQEFYENLPLMKEAADRREKMRLAKVEERKQHEIELEEERYPETDNPRIQEIIEKRSKRFFSRIGKSKSKKITLHAKDDVRSAAGHIQPERSLPFHLRKKFDETIDKLIAEGVLEEHEGPAEYISNPVLVPMI